ncbi:N-acetylornithine carbamoyltransferase [compost metagenome]
MKQFTSLADVPDLQSLLQKALEVKKNPFAFSDLGKNKTLGLVFFNPSLRTRMSTQKAAQNLGMNVLIMDLNNDGWKIETTAGTVMNGGTQEHLIEAAGVLSQYCDLIGIRTFPGLSDKDEDYGEKILNQFIRYAKVPVISLESATLHPLQSFADTMTIEEQKTVPRPKVVLTWTPHIKSIPQCVANSFAQWMKEAEVDFVIAQPEGMELSTEFTAGIPIFHHQNEALKDADFVYAKNWSSFSDYGQAKSGHENWMITAEKMALTNNGKFMHCLPVRRNVEVSDDVLDSANSLVLEQANNRTYAAQTVFIELLNQIHSHQ